MPGSLESKMSYSQSSTQNKATQLLKSIQNESGDEYRKILIRDLDRTKIKLESLISGGCSKFQIISDFDHTISKYRHNNHKVSTCHGIFELDPEVTSDAKATLKLLYDTYCPIETDPKLSNESKTPFMIEWWQKSHETIIKCGVTRSGLDKTVRECGLVSRDNVDQFFKLSSLHNIPVLVFSAGLGDVIQLYLKNAGLYQKNVRVISNLMVFNDQGQLIDFTSPIIHSFNKNLTNLASDDHLFKKPNILLIGDNPGDVHMADGLNDQNSCSVLRIGFLNDAIEANIDRYCSLFDIVLVNDDTFDVPLKIVQTVVEMSSF